VARAVRGLRLLRLITSFNRGMRALSATLGRRGFGYVSLLSALVTLLGAAGMYAFEKDVADGAMDSYATALWWTAMLMTTMGSEYWPKTGEGRLLCILLALYAFGVFGYVTATIATFFIGRDAENERAEIAGAKEIEMLSSQIALLRSDIAAIREQTARPHQEEG
jgi:voltage-gated potassium channel